jgi:hypothetical protein
MGGIGSVAFVKFAASGGSLVSDIILFAAVGTLPGNAVTGHPPKIFFKAILADRKAAPAVPAKGKFLSAAMASLI